MRDMNASDLRLGIIGAGAMGSGIAQVAAAGGIDVMMYDSRADAAAKAIDGIADTLTKRAAGGKMQHKDIAPLVDRIHPAQDLGTMASCDIVIEAIVEDLAIKQSIFKELEIIVSKEAILASNTSSLPIGALAAGLDHPERMAGLHFFNPVPVMKLVEIIPGPDTADTVVNALRVFSARLGRTPVMAKDTPGFLVNFGGRAYPTEALAILHENVASPADIDAVMRDGFGFRMGPFELLDLTGIDVNFPVTRFIHEMSFGDPRLRSTQEHRYLLETGKLGRKSGRGFYSYNDAGSRPDADATSDKEPATSVFVHGDNIPLSELTGSCGARLLASDDGVSPILAAPVGEDATAYAHAAGLDHRRLVCVDMIPDTSIRVTLMTAPGVDLDVRGSLISLFATRRKVTAIADSPGFIGQRIAAMVANLGCEMAQTGLASPGDIDLAMRLGLNYPKGPLELADAVGPATVLQILTSMQSLTGDDRYRPSAWLRRRATLGMPATHP